MSQLPTHTSLGLLELSKFHASLVVWLLVGSANGMHQKQTGRHSCLLRVSCQLLPSKRPSAWKHQGTMLALFILRGGWPQESN